MIKKIIIGTLLAILIGGLVYGAWYRTTAKAANETSRSTESDHSQSRQTTQEQTADQAAANPQQGSAYRGGGNGQGQGNQAAAGDTVDPQTGSRSSAAELSPAPQAEITELVTLLGSAESVATDLVTIAVAGQTPVELSGRSLTFATEQGFVIQPGDSLQLTGFYEDTDFEIQAIQNLTTGQALVLREETGRPLWAGGRGRRGG